IVVAGGPQAAAGGAGGRGGGGAGQAGGAGGRGGGQGGAPAAPPRPSHLVTFVLGGTGPLPELERKEPQEAQEAQQRLVVPSPLLLSVFQFQLRLVLFEKTSEPVGRIQQTRPLFIVQSNRKATEPVDADSTLFAHSEFQPAALLSA